MDNGRPQLDSEISEILPIAMVRLGNKGNVVFVNETCRELLKSMGLPPDALTDILPKRYRSVVRRVLTGTSEEVMTVYEGRALQLIFKPSQDGSAVFLFIIDLTQEEETKAQLMQSEKMASLGNLVAGLAHEINTPLGAIHSSNDTIARSLEKLRELASTRGEAMAGPASDFMRIVTIMEEVCRNTAIASERLIGISGSLKDFTRLDQPDLEKVDIHDSLDKTLTIVQHKMKGRIQIEKKYGRLPRLECHPNRLGQVFVNLLVNAAQAIPDRGTITIETSRQNDCVRIAISDDGMGIPSENIPMIFDPGFTTKGVGVGTGLGLSICYKIVQEHHGRIEVESGGQGTKFTVVLPIKRTQKVSYDEKRISHNPGC